LRGNCQKFPLKERNYERRSVVETRRPLQFPKKGFHPLFAFRFASLITPIKECASHGVNPMLRFSQRRGISSPLLGTSLRFVEYPPQSMRFARSESDAQRFISLRDLNPRLKMGVSGGTVAAGFNLRWFCCFIVFVCFLFKSRSEMNILQTQHKCWGYISESSTPAGQ